MDIEFGGDTDIGKVRQVNEDSLWPKTEKHLHRADEPWGLLFVVADGLGGSGAGDVASEIAVKEISERYYASSDDNPDIEDRLKRAFLIAHQKICDESRQRPNAEKMGTTATAVVVKYDVVAQRGTAWVVWVGDSRVYRFRHGKLEQLTRDHSRIWPLIETHQLDGWEAYRLHPDRSRLTNSLSAGRSTVEPDALLPVPLEPGDQLMLCSDGLSSEVRPDEIEQILAAYPPQEAVKGLIKKANSPKEVNYHGQLSLLRGGDDNISLIVVEIPGGEPRAALPSAEPEAAAAASAPPASSKWTVVAIAVVLALIGIVTALLFTVGPLSTLIAGPGGAQADAAQPGRAPQNPILVILSGGTSPTSTSQPEPAQAAAPATGQTVAPTATRRDYGPATLPPPTATPRPPTPTPQTIDNLPTPVLISPLSRDEDGVTHHTGLLTTFKWNWPGQLPENFGFEINVWLAGTERQGAYGATMMKTDKGFVAGGNGDYSFSFDLGGAQSVMDHGTSPNYLWSVGIVQLSPEYKWLGIESAQRSISILMDTGGSSSGGKPSSGGKAPTAVPTNPPKKDKPHK